MNSVSFYHFKKSVIGGVGDDGGIALWDINHSKEPMMVKENSHAGPIKEITFAPCNKHLYCTVGLDKLLQFHDIQQKSRYGRRRGGGRSCPGDLASPPRYPTTMPHHDA